MPQWRHIPLQICKFLQLLLSSPSSCNVHPVSVDSLSFLDRLGPDLRGLFENVVNFHNGRLPEYRGLAATFWAIVNGEARAGYTFHHVVDALDAGNILIQGSVPIRSRDSISTLETRLAKHAVRRLNELLDRLAAGDRGRVQIGQPGYYSSVDGSRMTKIRKPQQVPSGQLLRVCRAVGSVNLHLAGDWVRIRRMRAARGARPRPGHYRFTAADGVKIDAAEFAHGCYLCFRISQMRKRVRAGRRPRLANWWR